MTNLEYILDFCKEFGKQMLQSGSNIERVTLAMETICHSYGLHDVACYNLTSRIFISAKDENENYASRQTKVPPQAINLEKIKKLNNLSYKIQEEKPDPSTLRGMLFDIKTNDFPWWFIMIAFVVAMLALCRIFQGKWPELLLVTAHTLGLFWLSKLFNKISLNKFFMNFFCMLLCCTSAMLFYKFGFISNYYIVIITNAFFLIPGIPLVNSVRNLLCGNEQNGIIDLLKVMLEGCSIVAGIAAAYAILGNYVGNLKLEDYIAQLASSQQNLLTYVELTFMTLLATTGFSVVFNIQLKDIPFAALGGVIVRIVLILSSLAFPEYRFLYMTCAAFAAALYSQILAITRKEPSTLFLYPAIVPLIPGDLFTYAALGIIWQNSNLLTTYSVDLLLVLVGISIGFVICSSVVHYVRVTHFLKFKKN